MRRGECVGVSVGWLFRGVAGGWDIWKFDFLTKLRCFRAPANFTIKTAIEGHRRTSASTKSSKERTLKK